MYHDTEKIGCSRRQGNTLHVMTPSFEADAIEVAWSSCSRRDITNFLEWVSDQQTSDNLSRSVDKEVFCCDNCWTRLTCFPDEAEYVGNEAWRTETNTLNSLVPFASICKLGEI